MNEYVTHEELEAFRRELFSSLHVALPGTVESFDPETRTASVRPSVSTRVAPGSFRFYPLLRDVPVFLPAFSDETLSLSVSPGDECLLVFADRCIDGWFASGGEPVPPSGRMHDLSDGFAFVGFRSGRKPAEEASA